MAKTKPMKYKITYFSVRKQKNCKKDFASKREALEFAKRKALTAYGLWTLTKSVSP